MIITPTRRRDDDQRPGTGTSSWCSFLSNTSQQKPKSRVQHSPGAAFCSGRAFAVCATSSLQLGTKRTLALVVVPRSALCLSAAPPPPPRALSLSTLLSPSVPHPHPGGPCRVCETVLCVCNGTAARALILTNSLHI